jgi:hypothetical protein
MGRASGGRKAEAARENGRKSGGRLLKPLDTIACTCNGAGLDHASHCPRGQTIRRRQKRGLPVD